MKILPIDVESDWRDKSVYRLITIYTKTTDLTTKSEIMSEHRMPTCFPPVIHRPVNFLAFPLCYGLPFTVRIVIPLGPNGSYNTH